MPDEEARVVTLGYAERSLEDVLADLGEHGVDRLVDVRAINESSVDGFSGPELAEALGHEGIAYLHLGELGDFQPQPYPEYMASEDGRAAYEDLLEAVEEGTSALLCTCADVAACHRRFLARRLREDGFRVVHLTPAGPKEAVTFDGGA
jgi:uncharacterized protein (DUF488 family)